MGTKTVEAWVCDRCGHAWIKCGKTPVCCAKCKTRRWNDGGKPRRNRPVLKMPEWSEAKLREMAEAEDGAFVGVGTTPYNLAVLHVVNAQPVPGYPGHADGCACFRCRKVRG